MLAAEVLLQASKPIVDAKASLDAFRHLTASPMRCKQMVHSTMPGHGHNLRTLGLPKLKGLLRKCGKAPSSQRAP